ncbi:Mon2p [Sugiyamaella lignohabitans]|uniref:Mon2p n=1 Tax=Sugiyamaella lignohabitans TaxID=796027 RepID=A0A167ECL4_9ASCO|nr:Mon2p [Sugiyamaella lignohabitans]ANB13909.1 Mon2p [Sugiyamaella lignohabitans]
MIFTDLCNLTEKQKPVFLKKFNHLPETFGLELLESILTNHSDIFLKHVEFAYILRTRVVPLLLRAFSEKREFSVTVRVTRILYLLLRRQLPILKVEGEVILSLLTHMVDEDAAPYWKRLLCMEVFQGVCSEFSLVQEIYQEYDAQEGTRRAIIKCLIAAFGKISLERKDVIGYGPVSMPFRLPDNAATASTSGLHDENDPVDYSDVVGISLKTSVARVPCIDLLDKSEPPIVPDTYLYYLVLVCINSLCEGLTRKVFTQSPSSSSSNADMPVKFIKECWHELLSCYNTFFHATIDIDLYHSLVRSVQKLTHSAGFLDISEPMDAFMSLIGSFSVLVLEDVDGGRKSASGPSSSSSPSVAATATSMARNLLSVESIVGTLGSIREHQRSTSNAGLPQNTSASPAPTHPPTNPGGQNTAGRSPGSPTSRNILCFRALLNLAHSLGPKLSTSWDIVFRTIQLADSLANGSGKKRARQVQGSQVFSQLSEFSAVDTSFRRLLDSSKEFSESALLDMIASICRISEATLGIAKPGLSGDLFFALDLLREIGNTNMNRLVSSSDKTWPKLTDHLLKVIDTRSVEVLARSHSADVLNDLITKASTAAVTSSTVNSDAQRKVISTLKSEIDRVVKVQIPSEDSSIASTESDIHVSAIDTLNKVLDLCGGKFIDGWDLVFEIIDTVFTPLSSTGSSSSLSSMAVGSSGTKEIDRASRLVKSGFESMTLICNDFLIVLPEKCLINLVSTLSKFSKQESDLNISFTSISFFWTVSDHLRNVLLEKGAAHNDFKSPISDSEKLSEVASNGEFPLNIFALWTMSLLRLAITVGDTRAQVRNGSIQILFRILDSNGSTLPVGVWKTVQTIVTPVVMKVRPPATNDKDVIASWTETISLILNGFSSLYSSFIGQFVKQDDFSLLWKTLINYLQALIDTDASHLSLPVYTALNSVLVNFSKNQNISIPAESIEEAWEFWTSQHIPESPVDTKLTQEALTVFVQIHQPLQALSSQKDCSYEKIAKTIKILEQCTSFAHIPHLYSDRDHMSPLQTKSLERIESIDISDVKVASLILEILSGFVLLAFSTSETKSQDPSSKRPTYISLAAESLQLLKTKFSIVLRADYDELCNNQTIEKIFSSLLVLMEKKFDCPLLAEKKGNKPKQMWQTGTEIFLYILEALLDSNFDIQLSQEHITAIWDVVLKCGLAIITNKSTSSLQYEPEYEKFDHSSYIKFISLVERGSTTSDDFWSRLLRGIFESSAIYYRGKINKEYYRIGDPDVSVLRLVRDPFYGSTERPILKSRVNLSHLCLRELFRLSYKPPKNTALVVQQSSKFLNWRVAITLHQYVADQPLRGRMPMPNVTRDELVKLLNLVYEYHDDKSLSQQFELVCKCISVSNKDKEILDLLEKCLLTIHRK